MCRLLGVVARDQAPLAKLLQDVYEPFSALAEEHRHGWGVAHWSDDAMTVHRDTRSALASPDYDRAFEANADAAIVHLRLASPEIAAPCALGNTHPFTDGRYAFAHNGHFTPASALDSLISPELLATAGGQTDSERYFLRFLEHLKHAEPATAIMLAASDIAAATDYSSLNCLVLGSRSLYAYARENTQSEVSLRRERGFFDLTYRTTADRVLISSTGWPRFEEQWQTIPSGHIVEVDRADLSVRLHSPLR